VTVQTVSDLNALKVLSSKYALMYKGAIEKLEKAQKPSTK